MEPYEHDELLRTLVRIAAQQETITTDLRAFARQQVGINQDVATTLARMEALLARLLQQERHGREA